MPTTQPVLVFGAVRELTSKDPHVYPHVSHSDAPQGKHHGNPCLRGSAACPGTGNPRGVVQVMKLTSSAKEGKTTLDLEISRFVTIIVTLALTTVVVCMLVWALWLRKQHHSYLNLPEMLANVIGLAVAFIPEGLPGVCSTTF